MLEKGTRKSEVSQIVHKQGREVLLVKVRKDRKKKYCWT